MNPDLIHEPANEKTGAVLAAYCIYTLPDDTKDFVVMSASELDKVRRASKAKDDGPWVTWPEEMDKKTVIKRAMKLFEGASVELTIMLEADHRAMGFADYTEAQEPITMPKAIEATAKEGPSTPNAVPDETQTKKAETTKTTPTHNGSPFDAALKRIQEINAITHLQNWWRAGEKDREAWTGEEQGKVKLAYDTRLTQLRDQKAQPSLV